PVTVGEPAAAVCQLAPGSAGSPWASSSPGCSQLSAAIVGVGGAPTSSRQSAGFVRNGVSGSLSGAPLVALFTKRSAVCDASAGTPHSVSDTPNISAYSLMSAEKVVSRYSPSSRTTCASILTGTPPKMNPNSAGTPGGGTRLYTPTRPLPPLGAVPNSVMSSAAVPTWLSGRQLPFSTLPPTRPLVNSACVQRGVACGSPTNPVGSFTLTSLTLPGTSIRPSLETVLKTKLVV